jgi:glycosyltransferase involved in cell wall biosynthesis
MSAVFDRYPDVTLVIHCRPQDEGGNLYEEMARLPRHQWPNLKLTEAHDTWTGLPTEGLVALYNAADVYLQNSSEGFGLTIAEALACGVPAVAINHSAVPEVVGPGGVLVDPLHDAYGDIVYLHSTYGMDWAVPDPRAMVEPIATLLAKPQRRRELGAAGRAHVRRTFNWDEAADQFASLFASA